ncbi:hypothetical protein HY389_01165 [Candidatus Daviesbacteria bacterium]|nr:hypothetical protein [Candidatus Daviesbacteria bacterium]
MKQIIKQLLNFVSIPILVIPALMVISWLYLSDPRVFLKRWALISGFLTIIVPLGLLYYLRVKHRVADLDLTNKVQRLHYLRVLLPLYLLNYLVTVIFRANLLIQAISLDLVVLLLVVWLITERWKISLHMSAITALVTIAVVIEGAQAYFLILLIPALALHRLLLKRHSIWQVLAGFGVGLLITRLSLMVYGF